jgi:C-terminal processing protease CtpA/Prc
MRLPELQKRMQAASRPKTATADGNSPIELKFLDRETAYLNTLTFEYDLEKYKALLKDVFTQIKSAGVQNLIIDVRDNRGGYSALGDALIDMFNAKSYRHWTSKWKRSAFYAEYLKSGDVPLPESTIQKYLAARPGELLSGESELVQPSANPLRFGGRVYVLSGAKTFSSGVMFLGVIKDNKLAKIIGEETNEPACMFGEMSLFWLPNTRLRVSLSVRSWIPPAGCKGMRGVVPDVVVNRGAADYLTGRDGILETALNLIK